jgi:hypothetical protein
MGVAEDIEEDHLQNIDKLIEGRDIEYSEEANRLLRAYVSKK